MISTRSDATIIDAFLYYYDFIKQNKITDYPTTLYIVNGKVIDKTIGTMTLERFEQKINKIFN